MDIEKLSEFMELVGRLKHMKRTGWVLRDIPEPETIAGHMYRMAMLSFLVDNKDNLDKTKIMEMTLIHDLAECIVGDITPNCGVPPDEKHRMEDEAMEVICNLLGDKGPMILQMFRLRNPVFIKSPSIPPQKIMQIARTFWPTKYSLYFYRNFCKCVYNLQEYEKQESPEAQYVKDLDRLDLLMQAYEYEKRDNMPGNLEEFFVNSNGKIKHPFINRIACDINAKRKQLCQEKTSTE